MSLETIVVRSPGGPRKRTRAHSKKIEDIGKKDEVKAVAKNMQILVDQALDLIKST